MSDSMADRVKAWNEFMQKDDQHRKFMDTYAAACVAMSEIDHDLKAWGAELRYYSLMAVNPPVFEDGWKEVGWMPDTGVTI